MGVLMAAKPHPESPITGNVISGLADAQADAYAGVAKVSWANEFHRNDIGWRAIAREQGRSE